MKSYTYIVIVLCVAPALVALAMSSLTVLPLALYNRYTCSSTRGTSMLISNATLANRMIMNTTVAELAISIPSEYLANANNVTELLSRIVNVDSIRIDMTVVLRLQRRDTMKALTTRCIGYVAIGSCSIEYSIGLASANYSTSRGCTAVKVSTYRSETSMELFIQIERVNLSDRVIVRMLRVDDPPPVSEALRFDIVADTRVGIERSYAIRALRSLVIPLCTAMAIALALYIYERRSIELLTASH